MKFNYRTIQISMKKYINILILYFILSHCIGCNKDKISDLKKDFPTMELITAIDSIDLESKGLLLPFNVRSFDSCFVFSNIRTKNNVTILNRYNSEVKDLLYSGEGPNEILQYIPIQNNQNEFLFADRVRGKVFKLNLSDYTHSLLFEFPDTINRFFSLATIDTTTMIGTGLFDKGRFLFVNKKDDTYRYMCTYPENHEISSLSDYQKSALFAGTLIAVSPSADRFVAAYKGLIDFYQLERKGELSLIKHKYYHFPLFGIPEKGPVIAHKKSETTGFLSLGYDSNMIYLLYSNSSFQEKGAETFSGNTLLTFNWNGNPIKKYVLDKYLLSIHVEKDTIWGVSANHNKLYKYRK